MSGWRSADAATAVEESPIHLVERCGLRSRREKRKAAIASRATNARECVVVRFQRKYADGPKLALRKSTSAMRPAKRIVSAARQEAFGKNPRCNAREARLWVSGSTLLFFSAGRARHQ